MKLLLPRNRLLRGLIFVTDDVDAAFEHIRGSGAEVLQEPMDMPYGVRDCAFRDPAGNMIRFNQPRKNPPFWQAHLLQHQLPVHLQFRWPRASRARGCG